MTDNKNQDLNKDKGKMGQGQDAGDLGKKEAHHDKDDPKMGRKAGEKDAPNIPANVKKDFE